MDEASKGKLKFIVHWERRDAYELRADQTKRGRSAEDPADEDLDIIRKMAVRYGDDDIARVLNKLDRRTGKGMSWSQIGVKTARRLYGIAGPRADCGKTQTCSHSMGQLDISESATPPSRAWPRRGCCR